MLGNDGTPLQRLIAVENAAANVADVALVRPRAWLSAQDRKKLVIYAHGGLNDEDKSVERIRIMAPYFKANGIYPLFVTWRTGFGETLRSILEDQARRFGIDLEALRARGMFDDVKEAVLEAKDRAFEAVAEKILAKAVWTQMKQNAAAAIAGGGGLRLLAGHLETLRAELGKDLEIHLLGHSAGAILLGHLSNRLVARKIDIASLGLYAPACTMAFATDFLGKALSARRLDRRRVYFELLSDRAGARRHGRALRQVAALSGQPRARGRAQDAAAGPGGGLGSERSRTTSSTAGGGATSPPGASSGAMRR